MNPQNTNLPDNLKSRLSRVYVADKTFTDDSGKNVNYSRLVLEILVNGTPFEMEYKIDKKDMAILKLADKLEENKAF